MTRDLCIGDMIEWYFGELDDLGEMEVNPRSSLAISAVFGIILFSVGFTGTCTGWPQSRKRTWWGKIAYPFEKAFRIATILSSLFLIILGVVLTLPLIALNKWPSRFKEEE